MRLAVVLTLPIPWGNLLPAAAIAFMTLGMIERDGLLDRLPVKGDQLALVGWQ